MTIPLVVFDLETTAKDPREARIVTAFLGLLDAAGEVLAERYWLVDPGIEIPAETTAIHGVTTERARAEGVKPITAIREILEIINLECRTNGRPLGGQNIVYDLTVLDSELLRHGGVTLNVGGIDILDSYVIDKQIDKYRKGSRKLIDMARHYGVPISEDEAHNASFDAVASGRIIQRQLASPKMRPHAFDLATLVARMPRWATEQAESYAEWRRSPKAGDQQDPNFRAEQGWPIRRAA